MLSNNAQYQKPFPASNSTNFNSNDFFNEYTKPAQNSFNNQNMTMNNNMNQRNLMNNTNKNTGFFGNLALGPPPITKPVNNNTSLNQLGNNILAPTKVNGQQSKKSALDDLDDLFG